VSDVLFGFSPNDSTWPTRGSLFSRPFVSKRILIADDHKSVLRGLRASLGANLGWEICGDATDGKEAIAKAAELRPDLIVMDFAMPRLDGLRAALEIRKLLPSVPIVMNTLYGSAEVRLAANKHGIRRVVDKTNSGALISAVEELLSTEAKSQTSPPSDETSPALLMPSPDPDVALTGTPVVQDKVVGEPAGTATPNAFKAEQREVLGQSIAKEREDSQSSVAAKTVNLVPIPGRCPP
jgi:DNA-binding NarL/FixJ family response regulator